jgi:ubiquinone/menaquinone biosynthesis C-methylase UbiE
LAAMLAEEEAFVAGPPVFQSGDAHDLGFDDESFDLAVARLVFQYLADPQAAADELFRILRPGGFVCAQEVDDQLSITYPEVSDAFARLHEAFVEGSRLRGEDRYAGRKLSTWFESAGFEIVATLVWPQAVHGPSSPDDIARRFDVARLLQAREQIVAAGLMAAQDFDEALELYATEDFPGQFRCVGQIVVLGRRPQ